MRVFDMYVYAKQNGIQILYFPIGNVSVALPDGQIIVDPDYESVECLAHEIGHIQTGEFYTIETIKSTILKSEATATRFAIKLLIPKDELEKLAKSDEYVMPWKIAEYFDVSIEFAQKAIDHWMLHN